MGKEKEEALQPVLKEITHKIVLKVENNPRKADYLKKKIGKDFAVRKI